MNRALPVITEMAEALKEHLTHEAHPQRRLRLHARYLLASHQARSRTAVARLVGVHRETVGHWLHMYTTAGLTALLDIYVAAGRTPVLPTTVQADVHAQLTQPEGFASYTAIQTWLFETHHITITYKTLHNLLRTTFNAKPKVVRPSHAKKNEQAVTYFKQHGGDQLQAAIPDTNMCAVRVFTQDESRIGLQTIRRRRMTARGVKPIGTVQHAYANCWMYGCVAPTTGERFFLLVPKLNAAQMQVFRTAFGAAHADTFNVVMLDNRCTFLQLARRCARGSLPKSLAYAAGNLDDS